MLNPVQGVKTYAANHPKAAKAAKVGAVVVATAAVASVIAAGVASGKSNLADDAKILTRLKEGYKVLGGLAKDGAGKVADFVKNIPSKAKGFFAKSAQAVEEATEAAPEAAETLAETV